MDIRIIAGILLILAYALNRLDRYIWDFSGDWLNPDVANVPDTRAGRSVSV